ncbi:MAG: N-acyl-D-amino-acid deacylase family protein, partial [Polymorphobacter sp.]
MVFAVPVSADSSILNQDLLITGGTIYDGSGGEPYLGWIAIRNDRITEVGKANETPPRANRTIDATGKAVSPGFVNMLSWATESLIADGRALSDITQGVTLEVMGEGWSMGPLNAAMKVQTVKDQGDITYPVTWTTLGEYLSFLEKKGIVPNVASFVGATTVRVHEIGEGDVDPSPAQLAAMQKLVRQAMHEGAMGVGSSLIYAPAFFAETAELVALAKASADCGGMYISHIRNESDHIDTAIAELIEISKASGGPAEIYHLKQAGKNNWGKLDAVIAQIEAARAAGHRITADMYNYTAGATGLDASMPLWVQAGGTEAWIARLKDPATRAKVAAEMRKPFPGQENLLLAAGSPEKVLLIGFKNPALKKYTGMSLAAVAKLRGTSPEDTAIDLVIEDGTRVGTVYFLMDEANVARQTGLPWMAFGSDAEAQAPAGAFLLSSTHPRAYGNVSRLLGKYIRDENTAPLADAIRRLTSFPATNLGISDRGRLKPGYFADVVVFDPAKITDHATF